MFDDSNFTLCIDILSALGQATYFSAVCIQSTGLPRVQLQINKSASNTTTGIENLLQLIVDGTEQDISLITENGNTTQTLNGVSENVLFKRTNATVTVIFSTGVSITTGAANVSQS